MSQLKDFRSQSRINWGINEDAAHKIERRDLEFGCLLRIADATETMAENYNSLIKENDFYKRMYNQSVSENEILARRISALKGVITKLKNK